MASAAVKQSRRKDTLGRDHESVPLLISHPTILFYQGTGCYKFVSSGLYQDDNTSSGVITEVQDLDLNHFSDGLNLLVSGKCCGRKVGTMGCPLRYPFPLARSIWFTIRADLKKKSAILVPTFR